MTNRSPNRVDDKKKLLFLMSQNNKLADAPGVETPALRNLKPVVSPPDLPNGPDPLKAWILFIKLFPMPLPLPSAAWFEIHPSQLLLDSPQHWTVMHGEISVISANSTNINHQLQVPDVRKSSWWFMFKTENRDLAPNMSQPPLINQFQVQIQGTLSCNLALQELARAKRFRRRSK